MARSFNGTSDYIMIPWGITDVFVSGTKISVVCWFKGSVAQSTVRLQPTSTDYCLITFSNPVETIMSNDSGATFAWPSSGTPAPNGTYLQDGKWHHIALVWQQSGASNQYYDGVSWTSWTGSATALLAGGAGHTVNNFFGSYNGTTEFLTGSLADAAVYNAVLTPLEIAGLYRGQRPYTIRPKALVSYHPLDGLQSPEPDLSGSAFNGTLNGTAKASGPPVTLFTPRWPQSNQIITAAPFTLMPQIVT